MFKYGFEFPHRADPLTAREFVNLGSDDGCGIDCVPQPGPGVEVALQAGVSGVDQEKGRRLGWMGGIGWKGRKVLALPPFLPVLPVLPEKRPRQFVEPAGGFVATAGVSIAGEIHEVERLPAASRNAVDVREPGLAGCRAGPRDLLPDQRVDQARLADIRTPHECDFPPEVGGKVGRTGGARDEGDFDLQ